MIDKSEAVWITPNKVVNLKCSYCGKKINRVYNRARLDELSNVYCNAVCCNKDRVNLEPQEYEPDFSDTFYQPIAPEICQKHFGITNCLECTLPECKEVIIDNSGSKNYTGIILDLKKQLCSI